MAANISTDQLFTAQRRNNEIWRRLQAGSLNVEDLLNVQQGLLDGVYSTRPVLPPWYTSPESRLEWARQLNVERDWDFRDEDFPLIPEDRTKRWLLVIKLPDKGKRKGLQRTFDDRWDLAEAPEGYTKWCRPDFRTDPDHLRMAPGYDFTPGITWVEFDPEAFQGKSPEAALERSQDGNSRLAGTEILDAIWQFPDWLLTWFMDGKPAPNLSGLQFRWDKGSSWSLVPYLHWWDDDRRLELGAGWAGLANGYWASPVVREC